MSKKNEILSEGWVTFHRFYCKEGFIDRWMGDCINDPNNTKINQMQLNTMATYFRLNGKGEWAHRRSFNNLESYLDNFHDTEAANEIWIVALIY